MNIVNRFNRFDARRAVPTKPVILTPISRAVSRSIELEKLVFDGKTNKEIADLLGYKSASCVAATLRAKGIKRR